MEFFSDLTVAADDLVCSLEETFTKRREKSLHAMRQKISTLIDDLGHGQAVYRAVAQSVDEVTIAMTGMQGEFDRTVSVSLPPNLQAGDIRPLAVSMAKYVEKIIKISDWGLTSYQQLLMVALYARHGSDIARHIIQTSEAAILGTIGQATASSRLLIRTGTLGRQTLYLTKINRWVETLGRIATVASGVIVIIDVIMGAREIALMRHKIDELKVSLRALEAEVNKIDNAFSYLAEAGSTLYLAIINDDTDADGQVPKAMVTGMFDKVRNLSKLVSGDPMAHKLFHELRIDLNQENVRLRCHLLARIHQQLIDLLLWQKQVEKGYRMLADGIPIDRVQRTLPDLSIELLSMLGTFVNVTAGASRFMPHFTLDANGEIRIQSPTDDVATMTLR